MRRTSCLFCFLSSNKECPWGWRPRVMRYFTLPMIFFLNHCFLAVTPQSMEGGSRIQACMRQHCRYCLFLQLARELPPLTLARRLNLVQRKGNNIDCVMLEHQVLVLLWIPWIPLSPFESMGVGHSVIAVFVLVTLTKWHFFPTLTPRTFSAMPLMLSLHTARVSLFNSATQCYVEKWWSLDSVCGEDARSGDLA